MGAHTVLAEVSLSCSVPKGTFPRVTHPSAAAPEGTARLACIRPAASVRSEPGSNSQVELTLTPNIDASEECIGHLVYVFLDEFPFTSRPEDRPVHGIVFKRPQIRRRL